MDSIAISRQALKILCCGTITVCGLNWGVGKGDAENEKNHRISSSMDVARNLSWGRYLFAAIPTLFIGRYVIEYLVNKIIRGIMCLKRSR